MWYLYEVVVGAVITQSNIQCYFMQHCSHLGITISIPYHILVYVSFSTRGVGRFLASHSWCLQEEWSSGSASISCQAFLSPRTVSSQVFLGRPGPLVQGTLMDLHLLFQPLLRSTCPYQLRRFALNMFSSGAMLNFSISSCLLTSWLGLVLHKSEFVFNKRHP